MENSKFTSDQVRQKAMKAGVWDEMSEADKRLIEMHPDAGMTIVQGKQDWLNATTDEERALAHSKVESTRRSYGGYSGGADGSSFYINDKSPGSFNYDTVPKYNDKYASQLETKRDELLNRDPFEYNAAEDPVYSQYRKAYVREGDRATANALGEASATSGGIPSSYAVRAASQAGNYYASQLADKVPELYQQAYNRYLNELSLQLSDISVLQEASNTEYNRYLNELSQYNADRSFNYGQYIDDITWQNAQKDKDWEQAQTAANYGDYSWLNKLGVNTDSNPVDFERKYNVAMLAAQNGDFSKLRDLGIDPEYAMKNQKLTFAMQAAEMGDYRYLEELGIDTSLLKSGNLTSNNTAGVSYTGDDNDLKAIQKTLLFMNNGSYLFETADWDYLCDLYGEQTLYAAGFKEDTSPGVAKGFGNKTEELLVNIYGSKRLTQDQWDEILERYSSFGVTSEALRNRGFRIDNTQKDAASAAFEYHKANPNVLYDSEAVENWIKDKGYSEEKGFQFKQYLKYYCESDQIGGEGGD